MINSEIVSELKLKPYDFLRDNEHLGSNIILLTVGGSHAYGTNNENSDLDIRGCALNSKENILTNSNFEQFVNNETDTTIYSFNKLIQLLSNVNPNTIEMLGNKKEHYFYISDIGQELIDNAHLFLSKKAINSFGGYANQQLRRLENKSNRLVEQAQQEEYILNTIKNAEYSLKERYAQYDSDNIKLYINNSEREDLETEIFMDINFKGYPLRDYVGMWSELKSIVSSYTRVGKRNEKAIEHDKLGKHMMHLIRLYMMCLDILEKEKIITYRAEEHNLLMDIRNGRYLDYNRQPNIEFYEMVNEFDKRMEYAKLNTSLPDKPNYKKINEFVYSVNERIVKGEI